MKEIRRTSFEEMIGAPIFVRSFASVMKFSRSYEAGLARLKLDRWREHARVPGAFVNGQFIAWYRVGSWYIARRYKTRAIGQLRDRAQARPLFGVPSDSFVVPSTLVVPLVGPSKPSYSNNRCERVFPPSAAAPHELRVDDELVELRICRAEFSGRVQLYAEANFGASRYTEDGHPRRAVYLADHRQAPISCSSKVLVATTLMALPRFIREAGYAPHYSARRSDLLRVGYFDVLPGHESLCASMKWPSAAEHVLLAFEATPRPRVVRRELIQDVLGEVDESLKEGGLMTWVGSHALASRHLDASPEHAGHALTLH